MEKRNLIKNLISAGKNYKEVQKLLCYSAKIISNALEYQKSSETRGCKRILSASLVKRIVRTSRANPSKAATQIKDELNLPCGVHTVRR